MNWKIDYNNADIALQQTKFGLLSLKYRNGGMRMARKILIVDDEPLIVKGLKYSLEQDNYETDSAMDGEEALNKFFKEILLDGSKFFLRHKSSKRFYSFASFKRRIQLRFLLQKKRSRRLVQRRLQALVA